MKKQLLLFFLFIFSLSAFSQSNDEEADRIDITAAVQNYFDGMLQRDKAKLDKAFHPDARLVGYRGFRFANTPYADWASITARGEVRDPEIYKNKLIKIEIKGYTAVVSVELIWPDTYYHDYLTFLRVNNQWKIVNKTWYEEPIEN
jgi:hypothetical protein